MKRCNGGVGIALGLITVLGLVGVVLIGLPKKGDPSSELAAAKEYLLDETRDLGGALE